MPNSGQYKLLDCTLRDGGYYTNWDFEEKLVDTYFMAINKLPVDIIEIGYRSPAKANYAGEHFYLPDFVIKKFKNKTNKDLAIILNEKDVEKEDVEKLLKSCIGEIKMIRLAVAPQNFDRGISLAIKIKELGFQVAFNLMYASKWEAQFPRLSQINALNESCDYFYVVDSYGGLFPEDVNRLFTYLKSKLTIKLGFHGHNNLEMALANSLEAVKCGANIIDSTIDGMGRGAGNLKTELLLSVLYQRNKLEVDFDLLHIVREAFLQLKQKYNWGTKLPYMVSGAFSLPQNNVIEQVNKRYFSLNNIIQKVKGENNDEVEPNTTVFKAFKKAPNVFIVGGGRSGKDHKVAIQEFLKKNPEIPVVFASSKNVDAFKNIKNPQIHIIPGKELQRLRNYLSIEELKERILIVPSKFREYKNLKDLNFYKLPIKQEGYFPDSVTEYCFKVAKAFKAEKIYLIGYDGYGNVFNKAQQELFEENEAVFSHYRQEDFKIIAVTPSEYNIEKSSIYSFF